MIFSASFYWYDGELDSFFYKTLFDSYKKKFSYKIIELSKKGDSINKLDVEYNPKVYKGYFYKQKNNLYVFINNLADGWYTRSRNIALKNHIRGVQIKIFSGKQNPVYMMNYYDKCERVIYSMKDGNKWVFYASGEQQVFEKNDQYSENGATKKFNLTKLRNFCLNLGIDLNNPDILKPVSKIYYEYGERY